MVHVVNFQWTPIDTWIIVTGSLVSAACAIPGCYLFLRKQSMVADALTHSIFPGVVMAFVVTAALLSANWIDVEQVISVRTVLMLLGALIAGMLTTWVTQLLSDSQWVRGDAALGTVFTTMFAIGLLMLRRYTEYVDLDLDCVLYGNLELVGLASATVPSQTWLCGIVVIINSCLAILFHKELKLATFDPALANLAGFRPQMLHFLLLAVTTVTLVVAFQVVGSILVIGMFVLPAATASFISKRLSSMIVVSVFVAVSAAILGHLVAITLADPVTRMFGLPIVRDVKTSGMIVLVGSVMLCLAMVTGPKRIC